MGHRSDKTCIAHQPRSVHSGGLATLLCDLDLDSDLDLDQVIQHTVVYHSTTSIFKGNFVEI